MSYNLLTPILKGGIANTYFFNGRLLTAEAFRDEQTALSRQWEALGKAVGAGIVSGLSVSKSIFEPTGNVVHVDGGLAINRLGQPVSVPDSGLEIALTTSDDTSSSNTTLFKSCSDATDTPESNLPLKSYILVAAPASGYEGKAPMHGLNDSGTLNGCGSRYTKIGVQFRLVGLNINDLSGISAATQTELNALLSTDDNSQARLAMLRNRLAHLCLGTEELEIFPADPFVQVGGASDFNNYGVPDVPGMTDCDVPLALIHITTNNGIRFIDNWAVRRRVSPAPLSTIWPLPTGSRRVAEGEAIFLQFQDHMNGLVQHYLGGTAGIKATDHFHYLPPAGLVRLNQGSQNGVTINAFFDDLPIPDDPIPLEGAQLLPLLNASYRYPPINLARRELISLYNVRQNSESSAQPYLLFTTGHIKPQVDGRFDINHWNYFYFS